ncbi:type II toxin-antitoxin system ParD family antitoxin [Membranihabitans maritimus]|uniref:type II toxin-antitoxin system ParD family antitoxin n=1 Tax=Membranihabitans maritimus TaxID=2904244 RepID=UPI001F023CF7|nr:type II toxin-antitoxin system ParD family antitoxin [Membranihabitans maritimus]
MNISFTEKQEKYIAEQLESGDFKNAREVVRDALRLHEVYRHRIIEELRVEIARGWEGQASARKPSDIVRDKLSSLEKQAL